MECNAAQPGGKKRRWYLSHLPTCFLVAVVAIELVAANLNGSHVSGHWPGTEYSAHGWPIPCVWWMFHTQWDSFSMTHNYRVISSFHSIESVWWLLVDGAVALFILASTALVCEHVRREWRGRFQFRLSTLLWLVTVAASLLGLMLMDQNLSLRLRQDPWIGLPSSVNIPLLFGIGCAVYVAGRTGVWMVGKTAWKLSRMLTRQ